MKGIGSASGLACLEMAWSMVSLRLFCLEASELHTGLPTLWPEGDSMDLATRNKMEAGEPECGSEKLNAEKWGSLPEVTVKLVGRVTL